MAVTFARIGVMFGKMRTSGRPEPHRNRKVPLAKKSEQQTEAGLLLYPKNRVLCRLGDSEFDDGLGRNLHLLFRLGIEARACFPLLLQQLAKTGQDEFTVLLDLFVCERAERIEEYACGFFVGLGRSRECDFKFSLGHLIVVYGSGIAPFQDNRSRFHSLLTILIDVFHCANQSLDVDCLPPAPFGQGEDSKRRGANLRSLLRFPASFALLTPVGLVLFLGYAKLLRDR